jgi:hypothetical protein
VAVVGHDAGERRGLDCFRQRLSGKACRVSGPSCHGTGEDLSKGCGRRRQEHHHEEGDYGKGNRNDFDIVASFAV